MAFLNLIRAGITANRLKAAGQAAFTLASVTGTALNAAHLADEIARAIMGDDYDPALRDLAERVIEAGRVYDEKLDEVAQVNTDINNIIGGIDSLTDIVLDFGERQELVREKLEKLEELRNTFSTTTPRSFQWFEVVRAEAALEQIQQKGYADGYRDQAKTVYLIGVGFDSRQRGVSEWTLETIPATA